MRRLGPSTLHDRGSELGRDHSGPRHWKQAMTASLKSLMGRRLWPGLILLLCMISLLHRAKEQSRIPSQFTNTQISVNKLWATAPSLGWQGSCVTRSSAWLLPRKSNGYLVVRCNGGLNQQRSAICNAVLAARLLNATLVLPRLDTNSFWHDEGGFSGIYDVEHFINTLEGDVRVVRNLPTTWAVGKKKMKLKAFQMQPPRDAPTSWYETIALEKMKEHGAIYLTPFAHRLDENLNNHDYQRLRCRVNYHALRFNQEVRNLSSIIVDRLRLEGPYISIHLRFELDMLAFAGCFDIFTPEEQEILKEYRKKNFAEKNLEYTHRRLIGKCPLTPEEVGLFLRAMGFGNSTRIYVAAGDIFGGERFMRPLRNLFPQLESRSSLASPEELALVNADGHGLLGPAIDYMVCLLSDIFVPTYDGPSNFANNLIGQRLYYGFRTTLQPDRKALAPLYIALEQKSIEKSDFEASVRRVMSTKPLGGPHTRVSSESFYTNPWPECFCRNSSRDKVHQCQTNLVPTSSNDEDEEENFVDEWNRTE